MEPLNTPAAAKIPPRRFGTKSQWYILLAFGLLVSYATGSTPEPVDDLVPERMESFKKFTNENFVAYLEGLPNQRAVESSYQAHSLLDSRVGEIWVSNLKASDNDPDKAFTKTLPVLIADGWSDAAARDILSWGISKAYVILGRNPAPWCTSGDCAPSSDEEIRALLMELPGNSEKIIDAIFAELAVAP